MHLKTAHPEIESLAAYRKLVLSMLLHEWPQAVSPQVLRTRLADFKKSLCNANYRMGVCAPAAPARNGGAIWKSSSSRLRLLRSPPSWLPWSGPKWSDSAQLWYDQLQGEEYLQRVFRGDEEVQEAQVGTGCRQSAGAGRRCRGGNGSSR